MYKVPFLYVFFIINQGLKLFIDINQDYIYQNETKLKLSK